MKYIEEDDKAQRRDSIGRTCVDEFIEQIYAAAVLYKFRKNNIYISEYSDHELEMV